MTSGSPWSVESASRAAEADRLAEWVLRFLSSPGSDNEVLAAELALDGATFLGPVRLALSDLRPLAGPETSAAGIRVPVQMWNDEVDEMDESLAGGWDPPPILVSYRDGAFAIEDGNHRFDALRRTGATHTWAVIACWDESQRSACLRRLEQDVSSRHPR